MQALLEEPAPTKLLTVHRASIWSIGEMVRTPKGQLELIAAHYIPSLDDYQLTFRQERPRRIPQFVAIEYRESRLKRYHKNLAVDEWDLLALWSGSPGALTKELLDGASNPGPKRDGADKSQLSRSRAQAQINFAFSMYLEARRLHQKNQVSLEFRQEKMRDWIIAERSLRSIEKAVPKTATN